MVSRAVAAAVHLACVFGAALCLAVHLAGHIQALANKATTPPSGDSHAHAGAATVPLLIASTTYFLAVTRVYLELAVAANPGLLAAQRLAAATAKADAVTSLLALSAAAAAVFGGLWPYEI